MKKSILLGISSAFFFSFTFVLNSKMNILGGSWIWSASLRYIFMLPILHIIMILRNENTYVIKNILKKPIKWLFWSTVGFGLFYAPLSFSSVYSPSWVVSATWQITIIAGILLSPLFYEYIKTDKGILKRRNKIPKKSLMISFIILIGVFLIQFEQKGQASMCKNLMGVIPIFIAAVSYPLGNRKMMELCNDKFNTLQRVYGMTIASIPFFIFLSIFGLLKIGMPQKQQILQSLLIAIFSGIIATTLFFKATDLVKEDLYKLAAVEATQSGEVIFTLLGEILVLHGEVPRVIGLIGIFLVVTGIGLNSFISNKKS
ncbi:multidrug resistance efflux transporter family protein [Clostridium botulinum]|uniref:YjlA n=1 Tax=Clostridium botulinum D str. 1873 TaxID=592027 RepID=A0A9P2G7C0_CLOBO|nr:MULTISPECIES: multidrug resistance efflux transporter family protein [Clostridium]EES91382.1 YjlA [Clostridium botulinum D str. 1873]MBO3441328.1 multidrug resistance efflux transporter family protein [Clostridium haemolyticum]NFV47259.1 multidrug resistance efflux transporter family protein [Clostridium botulinum]QPW54907.1 multidrug resistance efflux transporter family protein [Clostridium botulinum]